MKTLEQLETEWNTDSEIDSMRIDKESSRIPNLHSKYYKFLNAERKLLIGLKEKLQKERITSYHYYKGNPSNRDDVIDKYGSKGYQHKIVDKEYFNLHIQGDISEIQRKIEMCELKIVFLEDVIRQINNRNFILKNMIDWWKFTNGEN